ncbi:hypothetical protein Cme02nite_15330 [Catellatospora methionotrophica]|uniref:Uncharacterized protein n=1 Tax=Catellatospora methionotrophica TaxID=121620 RepID=A0A8J3PD77_9ACTN|nr:hypothetical protein [Catellatospora methionotrophica]GIG13201.1 hypothetical protein Cme02nite_15330 [Catellatospora methionotrophica]
MSTCDDAGRYFGHDVQSLDALWADLGADATPEDQVDLTEVFDRHLFEALQEYHPGQRLDRTLDLRLSGQSAELGTLDFTITNEVYEEFGAEVSSAAVFLGMPVAPTFALVGVSPGSVVLHLAPSLPELDDAEDGALPDLVADPVDGLLECLNSLHQYAEQNELQRFVASGRDAGRRGKNQENPSEPVLKALHGLVKVLDKHNLSLDLRWRAGDGRNRRSQLTERGRAYVRRLWDTHEVVSPKEFSGRIVGMSLNTFTIKPGSARKVDITVEGDEGVLRLNLPFGEPVTVLAEEVHEVNSLGIQTKSKLIYVSHVRPNQLF